MHFISKYSILSATIYTKVNKKENIYLNKFMSKQKNTLIIFTAGIPFVN